MVDPVLSNSWPPSQTNTLHMSKFWKLLILLLCFMVAPAFAGRLAVGDAMPAITANDQHGVPFVLTTNIQTLLVATEMDCAKSANRQLAAQAAGFLDKHKAGFLMDIHSMPGIARPVRLPENEKISAPHRVHRFADNTDEFPVANEPSRGDLVKFRSYSANCVLGPGQ